MLATLPFTLTLLRISFFGAAHVWEGKMDPLPKICHTYPTMTKFGSIIPYLNKIKKIYKSHLLSLLTSAFFHGKSAALLYQEIQIQIDVIISNSFKVFKGCFGKHGSNFDDVSKVGYSKSSQNKDILK